MPPKRKAAQVSKHAYEDEVSDVDAPGALAPGKRSKPRTLTTHEKQAKQQQSEETPHRGEAVLEPPGSQGQETQQFQETLAAYTKKQAEPRVSFAAKFEAQVNGAMKEILAVPDRWESQCMADQAKYIKALTAELSTALNTPTHPASKPKADVAVNKDYSTHPLYAASNAWLTVAGSTIDSYSTARKLFDDAAAELEPLGVEWQAEMDALLEILEMGQRVARRQVERMMAKERPVAGMGVDEKREVENVKGLLGMDVGDASWEGQQEDVSWVESVRAAERGTRRLVRGLPSAAC